MFSLKILPLQQTVFWGISALHVSLDKDVTESPISTFGYACPLSCVCQQAQLEELPIQRWIGQMQRYYANIAITEDIDADKDKDAINLTTCIVLPDTNIDVLLASLPTDTEALNLLYTGVGQAKSSKSPFRSP